MILGIILFIFLIMCVISAGDDHCLLPESRAEKEAWQLREAEMKAFNKKVDESLAEFEAKKNAREAEKEVARAAKLLDTYHSGTK